MEVFDNNPYKELPLGELDNHLVELNANWRDVCSRQSELSLEATINQEHRRLLTAARIAIHPNVRRVPDVDGRDL